LTCSADFLVTSLRNPRQNQPLPSQLQLQSVCSFTSD